MHLGRACQENSTADADDGQIMNHEQMLAYCVHSLDKANNEMRWILQVKEEGVGNGGDLFSLRPPTPREWQMG